MGIKIFVFFGDNLRFFFFSSFLPSQFILGNKRLLSVSLNGFIQLSMTAGLKCWFLFLKSVMVFFQLPFICQLK